MRIEVPAREVQVGDQVWFPNTRKPNTVVEAYEFNGTERQVVLKGDNGVIWYQFYDTAVVNKYVPEPEPEAVEPEFLDPDGNPT